MAILVAAAACRGRSEAAAPAKAAPEPAKAAAPATVDRSIAMLVLVQGTLLWMGDGTSDLPGNYDAMARALDALGASDLPGAKAEILLYGHQHRKQVLVPFGDLRAIHGSALGPRARYEENVVADFAEGLEQARADLLAQPASRKVLVVIGDGLDFDDKVDLHPVEETLRRAGIETHTILVPVPDTGETASPAMVDLGRASATLALDQDIAREVRAVIAQLRSASPSAP